MKLSSLTTKPTEYSATVTALQTLAFRKQSSGSFSQKMAVGLSVSSASSCQAKTQVVHIIVGNWYPLLLSISAPLPLYSPAVSDPITSLGASGSTFNAAVSRLAPSY
jgi:hypothetical protein